MDQPARTDRYGDPLPEGAIARLGTVRWRHPRAEQVLYSRDGKTVYSAGLDLRQWDAATGQELHRWDLNLEDRLLGLKGCILDIEHKKLIQFEGNGISFRDIRARKDPHKIEENRESILSVAFSPDGKLLASRCRGDGSARLWDMATGRELRRIGKIETTDINGRSDMDRSLAFTPDGKLLAVANEEGILRLLDVATGEEKRMVRAPTKHLNRLLFSPDGGTLAWESEDNLCLWDARRGGEPRRIKAFGKQVGERDNFPFAFSPDSKVLASGRADGTIHFWRVTDGRELRHTATQSAPVSALAFAPDGQEVVAVLHDALRFWDVATAEERRPLAGHESAMTSLAFSPDGKTVRTTSFDKTIRVWDVTGRQRRCLPFDSKHTFSPDGSRFAFLGQNGVVHVRDVETGRELYRSSSPELGYSGGLVFVADNKTLLSNNWGSNLPIWNMETGKVRHLTLPGENDNLGWGTRMHFSLDGSRMAVFRSFRIYLLETATGREFSSFKREELGIGEFAFAPDGRSLITVGCEETFNVINGIGPGRQTHTFRVHEAATGQERCRFKSPPNESVNAVAISPDGRLVVFAGSRDQTIFLWELATGKQIGQMRQRDHRVSSLAFSPDGRTLASASYDTTALLWDVASATKAAAGRSVALSSQERKQLGARLSDKKASVAYRAMVRLAASPSSSVPFLRDRLPPVAIVDARRVRKLFTDLDSEVFAVRNAATHELDRLGEGAAPALRELLAGKPSLEVRRRVETLMDKWGKQPLPLEILRSLEVLEWIGSYEARQVLESIAKGASGAQLTREAEASVRRLSHRSVAKP